MHSNEMTKEDSSRSLVLVICHVRCVVVNVLYSKIISVTHLEKGFSGVKRNDWSLTGLDAERLGVVVPSAGFMVNGIFSDDFNRNFSVVGFLLHVSVLHFLVVGSKDLTFQQVIESNLVKDGNYGLDVLGVYFHASDDLD